MLELEGLHIKNADLFQVVAYGRHRDVQAQGSLLIYPVLEAESVCRQRCILDFMAASGDARPFPVFLVGMPVGETLNHSIDSLVRMVQEIAAGPVELEAAHQPIARA